MAFLILDRGSKGGERIAYPLRSQASMIGRSLENAIPIDDPHSSRRHCEVRFDGQSATVRDLGSRNGTLVNGKKLDGERLLVEGDVIEIGEVRFTFTLEAPGAPSATRPTRAITRTSLGLARPCPECARLREVLELSKRLSSELDLGKLLASILDTAIELSRADRGFLILVRPDGMEVSVARNFEQRAIDDPVANISRSICQEVAKSGKAVVTDDASADDRFRSERSVQNLALRSVACLPLKFQEAVLGVLYIDNRFQNAIFGPSDLEILEAFASSAAISVYNAQLVGELVAREKEVKRLNDRLSRSLEERTKELATVKETLANKQREFETLYNYDRIIGRSEAMQRVFRLLDRIVPTDVPVILQGESGTGKELVSKAIHFNGPRKSGPFVSLNCAAVSETLLESELFGHVQGAFTGADSDKKGLFELATGGTIFLDEVSEMSTAMQKKLLRVLQESEFRRVGGKDLIKVDVRVVSATNCDLQEMVDADEFRADLYYRLAGVVVELPALRQRPADIPILVQHFLAQLSEGRPQPEVSDEAMKLLCRHGWPGNVRQLFNEVRRAVAIGGPVIGPGDFSPDLVGGKARPASAGRCGDGVILKDLVDALEKQAIVDVLEEVKGNKTTAAKILGLSRPGLRKKMARFGLNPD